MRIESAHLSEEELLSLSDRELSERDAAHARKHLSQCPACRDRLRTLESTLSVFDELQNQIVQGQQFRASSMRAPLKLRLSEARASYKGTIDRDFLVPPSSRLAAIICLAVFIGVSGWQLYNRQMNGRDLYSADLRKMLPQKALTPGVVRNVGADELCGQTLDNDPPVNASLKETVFKRYSLPLSASGSYELDYLIAPALGGTDDIGNLWPQPSTSARWNSHAKDRLEDRLRTLVCQSQLPLATAQEEISKDWIASYRKHLTAETSKDSQEPVDKDRRLYAGSTRLID